MYGEILIVINMLFNYAILSFANKVGNVQVTRKRLVLASLVGSIPVVVFPTSPLNVVLTFIAMTTTAFGWKFISWRKSASLVLIGTVVAGGLLTALQLQLQLFGTVGNVLILALVVYITLFFMKRQWLNVRLARSVSSLYSSSKMYIWNVEVEVDVFVDTGNSCTEPLSSSPVHFIALNVLQPYLPKDLVEPLMEWNPLNPSSLSIFPESMKKEIRLIRLMTVQGSTWAVGIKFDKWILANGERLRPGYFVITKNDQRYPEGAQAILHLSAMESIIGERGIVHVA